MLLSLFIANGRRVDVAVGEAGDAGSWTGRASAVLPQREMTGAERVTASVG